MDPVTIITLIATYGVPATTKIVQLWKRQKPDDVTASEWLELLVELKTYTELRNEMVKPVISVTPT